MHESVEKFPHTVEFWDFLFAVDFSPKDDQTWNAPSRGYGLTRPPASSMMLLRMAMPFARPPRRWPEIGFSPQRGRGWEGGPI
jgi:hypothetical protein